MDNQKSMDLGAVKAEIRATHEKLGQVRSMEYAKNLTANNNLDEIFPVADRIVVSLKAWPAQSIKGIFMPESYTVIRGEMYVTEVVAVGPEVTLVEKGDVVIVSMYSGHHVTTKTGHAKIISEGDILNFKKAAVMKKTLSFDPKTFEPGINYILIELIEKKTVRSAAGIIMEMGEDDAMNTTDVATKTGKVLAVGPVNEFGKKHEKINVGSIIIFDAYVGIPMNAAEVTDSEKYRIMFGNDILGYIVKK
jgi:co-chaperonin GroES (HSP10)